MSLSHCCWRWIYFAILNLRDPILSVLNSLCASMSYKSMGNEILSFAYLLSPFGVFNFETLRYQRKYLKPILDPWKVNVWIWKEFISQLHGKMSSSDTKSTSTLTRSYKYNGGFFRKFKNYDFTKKKTILAWFSFNAVNLTSRILCSSENQTKRFEIRNDEKYADVCSLRKQACILLRVLEVSHDSRNKSRNSFMNSFSEIRQ